MRHDETALVREALRHAEATLERGEPLLPAAYLLVRCNPQTGARLTHPTAIGSAREAPFGSHQEYLDFLALLRSEARRLEALAVALGGEAEAELEPAAPGQPVTRERVFYLRIEDADGIHHLHARIERDSAGTPRLGPLQDAGSAGDDLPQPLMPRELGPT